MRLITKLLLFFTVIILAQALFVNYIPNYAPQEFNNLQQALDQNLVDILYFGDSSDTTFDVNEDITLSINEFLAEQIPFVDVFPFTHEAYQADVFASAASFISKQKNKPQVVVVTINLRSFSPEWDKNPKYQFERLRNYFDYYGTPLYPWVNFLDRFNLLKLGTEDEESYKKTPVVMGTTNIGTVDYLNLLINNNQNDPDARSQIVRYFYLSELKPNHRKLQSLKNIHRDLDQVGIKVLYYFSPLNYEVGEETVGPEFTMRVQEKVETIMSNLTVEDKHILDLTLDLDSSYFAKEENLFISEHLNHRGRQYVAEQLAEAIRAELE